MSVLRSSALTVGVAAVAVLSVAAPASAATSQVHLRAGAEPAAGTTTTWAYGTYGDRHLLCDWDGDGDATLGLYRASNATWYVRQGGGGGNAQLTFRYGRPGVGDRVLCGDWDDDGDATPGLFRAADNTWHLRNTNTAGPANRTFRYGRPGAGDVPLVGDWDGDGDDTPGIFRASDNVWYLRNAATGGSADLSFRYGRPGVADTPIVGDWDGNATDTPGIFRAADRTMNLRNSNSGGPATWSYPFGAATDRPLAGDWDADGRDEPAVAREFAPVPPTPRPPAQPGQLAFGSTYTYPDGLRLTIGRPAPFTPSPEAAGAEGAAAVLAFDVTVVNQTGRNFDPADIFMTAQSGNTEASAVFDFSNGLEGEPSTVLLSGRTSTWKYAFGVSNPNDLVLEVNRGFDQEPVIYVLR